MILMDSADVAVTSNEYVCWNIVELSALRMIQYGLPIFMVVALERQFTEFELSVGNSGIFFPNILVCCLGSRRFRVDGIAKGLFEGGQGDFPFAVRKQLPMEISCCISLFELSSDIIKVRWKIRYKQVMRDGQQPVPVLRCWHLKEKRKVVTSILRCSSLNRLKVKVKVKVTSKRVSVRLEYNNNNNIY